MPVISLLNQKGGVGKTTLALHIAYQLAAKHAVLLIDADPQGSSLDWSAQRETTPPFNIIGLPKPVLHREIDSVGKGYDWIIIDGPPRSTDIATSAISASDLVLIPIQPSPFDIWAAKEIIKTISDVQTYRPQLKARFVINSLKANTTLAQEVDEALSIYPDVPRLPTCIHDRTEYAKAPRFGLTVAETEPGGKADLDIQSLVKDIRKLIGGKR